MKSDNIILEKSCNFAVRTVKLCMHIRRQKVERELLIQLLKSGTSTGAGVEEAIGAQSKSDFTHKLGVACKVAGEASYWLRLFIDAKIIEDKLAQSFLSASDELKKILASILKRTKGNWKPQFLILNF